MTTGEFTLERGWDLDRVSPERKEGGGYLNDTILYYHHSTRRLIFHCLCIHTRTPTTPCDPEDGTRRKMSKNKSRVGHVGMLHRDGEDNIQTPGF